MDYRDWLSAAPARALMSADPFPADSAEESGYCRWRLSAASTPRLIQLVPMHVAEFSLALKPPAHYCLA